MAGVKGKIGLEIHSYVRTREKLFCKCKASREKGQRENTLICPICTGQPGAKPMLPNEEAVKKAVQIGLMLGCRINNVLKWQRKHYDWPDLPKGYQNTVSGAYAIPVGVEGKFHGIGIWSMHLEEDPASWNPETGCIDYNRSGLPLVEIVTAPDFSSSEEVISWLRKLLHNLDYLKAIDSNAGIKVDVNVNLGGKTERVEIKNINSLENIKKAIDYEIKRQLKEGSERETRRFDAKTGKTIRMRGKEEAEDYRFITEPDLQDIVIDKKFISEIEKKLPEKPEEKLRKFIKKHRIGKYDAEVLAKNVDIADFTEQVAKKIDVKFALPWITGSLLRLLNEHKVKLDEIEFKSEHFVELLEMLKKGKVTELQAKQILKKFYPKSFSPIKRKVGGRISDRKKIEKLVWKVLKEHKRAIEDYNKGEKKAFHFLLGKIMRASDMKADFKVVREVLDEKLK